MIRIYNCSGRRKKAIARVFLSYYKEGGDKIMVNGKYVEDYFCNPSDQYNVRQPVDLLKSFKKTQEETSIADPYFVRIKANVKGGGFTGQSEAIRLAVSKAILDAETDISKDESAGFKMILKKHGFLTRDSRRVERKKPGRLKARKKKQFNKR